MYNGRKYYHIPMIKELEVRLRFKQTIVLFQLTHIGSAPQCFPLPASASSTKTVMVPPPHNQRPADVSIPQLQFQLAQERLRHAMPMQNIRFDAMAGMRKFQSEVMRIDQEYPNGFASFMDQSQTSNVAALHMGQADSNANPAAQGTPAVVQNSARDGSPSANQAVKRDRRPDPLFSASHTSPSRAPPSYNGQVSASAPADVTSFSQEQIIVSHSSLIQDAIERSRREERVLAPSNPAGRKAMLDTLQRSRSTTAAPAIPTQHGSTVSGPERVPM